MFSKCNRYATALTLKKRDMLDLLLSELWRDGHERAIYEHTLFCSEDLCDVEPGDGGSRHPDACRAEIKTMKGCVANRLSGTETGDLVLAESLYLLAF